MRIMKNLKKMFLSLGLILAMGGGLCAADPKDKKKKLNFDDDIASLLREKCGNCHNADKKSSGLIVTNFTKLMEGGSGGIAVKPGDPDASPLYTTVAHKAEPFMPPKSPKLPDEYANTLQRWILEGALENSGSKAVAMKPKADISLGKVSRGRPEGPPPMPEATAKLPLDPVKKYARANAITALASSPWAPLVAVAGNKQVLLYNSDTGELLGVLPFPEGVPQVLKFSRNGSLLLAGGGRGSALGRVVVWNVRTGERIIQVGEETDSVLAADISPDQTLIALGSPSKMVRIYSTKDGKLLSQIKKHTDWITSLEFSPDGVLLATGDRSGGLFVWEAFTAREYYGLRGHTAMITDISWRPDSNMVASSSEDGTIRLWEMENGGQVKSWGHGAPALSVRYGMDGQIVSAGRDRTVKLWDGNGALKKAFPAMPDLALKSVLSHDSARALGGDWSGVVEVWTVADGKKVGELSSNPELLADRATKIASAVKTAEGAAVASKNKVAGVTQRITAITTQIAAVKKLQADPSPILKPAQAAQATAQAKVNEAKALVAQSVTARRSAEMIAAELAGLATRMAALKPADAPGQQVAADAQKRATELSQKAQADLAAAKKREADTTPALAQAEKNLVAANAGITAAQQQVQQLPKRVTDLAAAEKAIQAELVTAQNELKQIEAEILNLKAQLQRSQAALASNSTSPKK
jgi:hypothetical protein